MQTIILSLSSYSVIPNSRTTVAFFSMEASITTLLHCHYHRALLCCRRWYGGGGGGVGTKNNPDEEFKIEKGNPTQTSTPGTGAYRLVSGSRRGQVWGIPNSLGKSLSTFEAHEWKTFLSLFYLFWTQLCWWAPMAPWQIRCRDSLNPWWVYRLIFYWIHPYAWWAGSNTALYIYCIYY